MSSSSSSKTLLREMLRLARRLPVEQAESTKRHICEEFRKSWQVTDPEKIKQLLQSAESSLGYLRMITPKSKEEQSGSFRRVYGNTEGGVSSQKAVTNWHGGNIDPDSRARHFQNLKRGGFRDNAHAKGMF